MESDLPFTIYDNETHRLILTDLTSALNIGSCMSLQVISKKNRKDGHDSRSFPFWYVGDETWIDTDGKKYHNIAEDRIFINNKTIHEIVLQYLNSTVLNVIFSDNL